jgi:photosystem II stability/assembly factor-like uncharacterized protein
MKRTAIAVVLTAVLLMIFPVACDDVSGPSPIDGVNGWTVGDIHAGFGVILHTVDGGNTWIRQGNESTIPDASFMAVRAADSLNAWVVGSPADGYGTILRTRNAGETWERLSQSTGIPAGAGMLDLDLLSANDVWVVGSNNTILHTSNGGSSWSDMSDPLYNNYGMTSISVVDASNIWVSGATPTDAIILHSTDGGNNWTAEGDSVLLIGYPLISISAFDQDHCWTVGHGYTFAKTVDSGQNWTLCVPDSLIRTTQSDDANGICPTDANRAWAAVDYGRLYLTIDGGTSWIQQSVPINAGGFYLLRTCALDHNNAWTVGTGIGAGIILHTTDGTTWTSQDAPSNNGLNDVSFVDSFH